MDAGQCLDFLDQRGRFLMGDEFGGLDAVYQQLQLRKLKIPVGDIVPAGAAGPGLYNIQTEILESFDVTVNAFELCGDALGSQIADDLIDCNGVIFVGVLQKIVHDIERFQLLIRRTGHTVAVLSVSARGCACHFYTSQCPVPLIV